ncbi:hypothetical protein J4219_02785 [Candidatus Woesearchaeota archaeon]|nr:hypothetical protein [Candidatus Woesearchaeota archaeon]
MNWRILLFAFILGIVVGFSFIRPHATGAVVTCFAENEPCVCDTTTCSCGNQTLPAEYCSQTLNTESDIQQMKEDR